MKGEANEVPDCTTKASSDLALAVSISTPKQTTSGFTNPSLVGPRPDLAHISKGVKSTAPTDNTQGSTEGDTTLLGAGPWFPAAAITPIPISTALRSATRMGLSGSPSSGMPKLRFNIKGRCGLPTGLPRYNRARSSIPRTTFSGVPTPRSFITLMFNRCAPGAAPCSSPSAGRPPAAIKATPVPWSKWSSASGELVKLAS